MISAAIYQRDMNKDASEVGAFFAETLVRSPYHQWWQWANQSLIYVTSQYPSEQELNGLRELIDLSRQRCPVFPQPLPPYRVELEAALWWRMGEAYRGRNDHTALEWYEKVLVQLKNEHDLQQALAETCYDLGKKLYDEKKYRDVLLYLNRAIEVEIDFMWAYNLRGAAYAELKDYRRAITDYDQAIQLDPTDATVYSNRGEAYRLKGEYQFATRDFSRSLELADNNAWVYGSRGQAFLALKNYQLAIQDFNRAIELDPDSYWIHEDQSIACLWMRDTQQAISSYLRCYELDPEDINAAWMAEWAGMGRIRPSIEAAERLEKIASIDPQSYLACVCRALATGLRGKLKGGLAELEQALVLETDQWDPPFWNGMLSAYYHPGRSQIASEAVEKALALGMPPILLTPLYWLQRDRPDFFKRYAQPLLEKYKI
jgi:tetratricopeptide (TPR) repeat protein